MCVAQALELDVNSSVGNKERAVKNSGQAGRLFLEEAEKIGKPHQILESKPDRGMPCEFG